MDSNEFINHFLDIKQRLSVIETRISEFQQDMKDHRAEARVTQEKVGLVDEQVKEAKTALSTLKWIVGVLIAIPPLALTLMKIQSLI